MKLIVKNRIISLTGESVVTDENENKIYKVKGKLKIFSPTRKKRIYDMEGKKLYTIRNKWWNFFLHSAYIYDAEGNKIAKLKNKFSRKAVYLSEGFPDAFRIGKHPDKKGYAIYRNEQLIGSYFRSSIFVDSFEVDYDNPKDASILVALIIAIDNIQDNYLDD